MIVDAFWTQTIATFRIRPRLRGNALMLASRAPDVDIPRTEVDGVE